MVDTRDLKSLNLYGCASSSLASGTMWCDDWYFGGRRKVVPRFFFENNWKKICWCKSFYISLCINSQQTEKNMKQVEMPSKAKLRIQVLSTPSNENTNNPMLKLKCISDLGNPVFEWKYLNGSMPRNVDTSSDILTISPFTQYNSGSYICTAYYPLTNEHAFKIINIHSKFKSTINLSDKIRVDLISSPYELRRGGNVKIRCSIGKIDSSFNC